MFNSDYGVFRMSIAVMAGVFAADIKPSSSKFVLLALADCADDDGIAWPSTIELASKTSLDRKTVIRALDDLESAGLLIDTGNRRGRTAQVKEFRITLEGSQKRKRSQNGTVPLLEAKAPVFPVKGSQKRDTEPSLNHQEPSDLLGDSQASGIPYEAIRGIYNRLMVKLPSVLSLNQARKTAIRLAWQESPPRRNLKFWEDYFAECSEDAFLNGTGPYKNGHENWQPTFDFLIRGKTITSVVEKAIHRSKQAANGH